MLNEKFIMTLLLRILSFLFIVSVLMASVSAETKNESFHSYYTSLKDRHCKLLHSSDWNPKAKIDSFSRQCPGRGGVKVFIRGADARSWLDIEGKNFYIDPRHFSSAFPVSFPYVSGEKLEWFYSGNQLVGFIYRVSGMDLEDYTKIKTVLAVARIDYSKSWGCILGTTSSNAQARELLKSRKPCP